MPARGERGLAKREPIIDDATSRIAGPIVLAPEGHSAALIGDQGAGLPAGDPAGAGPLTKTTALIVRLVAVTKVLRAAPWRRASSTPSNCTSARRSAGKLRSRTRAGARTSVLLILHILVWPHPFHKPGGGVDGIRHRPTELDFGDTPCRQVGRRDEGTTDLADAPEGRGHRRIITVIGGVIRHGVHILPTARGIDEQGDLIDTPPVVDSSYCIAI